MRERIVSTSFVGITVTVISNIKTCDITIHIPKSLIPPYGFQTNCSNKFHLQMKFEANKELKNDLKITLPKKAYPKDRYGFIQTGKTAKLKASFSGEGYSGCIELSTRAYFSNQRIQKIRLEKEKLLKRANKKSILTAIF